MASLGETLGDKNVLIQRLQDALAALESGDEAGWRREIDALAALRTQPMMAGLGRLARELGQALGELPSISTDAGELDDACARLDHVVEMTEKATHRTLDLAEECRTLTEQLRAEGLSPDQDVILDRIRHNLTEVALTQSYQDLTGQIIRRVVGIVRRVHEGFGALGLPPPEEDARNGGLAGPAVNGLDRHAVSQHDADDLLSDLGL
jgi:chemotaxis protein CheZ